jgi:hypothetical protein
MKIRIYLILLLLVLVSFARIQGQTADSSKFWIVKADVWNPWFFPVAYKASRFGVEFERVDPDNRALSAVIGGEFSTGFERNNSPNLSYSNLEFGLRYYLPILKNKLQPGEGLFIRADVLPGLFIQKPPCYDFPVKICDPAVMGFIDGRLGIGFQKGLRKWLFSGSGTAGFIPGGIFTEQTTLSGYIHIGRRIE